MIRYVWFLLLILSVPARSSSGQSATVDNHPSGPFAIGRVSYDWVDTARPEVLSPVPHTSREIIVDVWYPAAPAKPGALTAPYLPDADQIEKSGLAEFEKHWWRTAWPMIVSGSLHTHTYDHPAVAPGDARFPLLIFSHGYSVDPFGYTQQIEELVSRGYVVATIHHTYEVAVTVFPGGRIIPYSVENGKGQDSSTVARYRSWEKKRVDVWAADIRFTLDQIARLVAAPEQKAPFVGRVDTGRVGAFGHSFGGLAAARACALDPRFAACINQDGVGLDGPIPHYGEGHMPTRPFLFLRVGPRMIPTIKDGMEQQARIEKEIQECSGGSYQVWVGIPGFRHMGIADFFFLQATNPEEAAKALAPLHVVEAYTAAFFDKFLNGAQDTLLDRDPAKDSYIVIKRYPQ